ncbi:MULTISPECIES: sigma-54-dependent Fis family transcriptional regulator [Pelosinus]|uniref:PAS sensor protein n=1 Tax=Pelosinus fermentans B4 TaxID=1149862 RepID=I9LE87_9FIRM|nr:MULTISPECIES: sigma-54-dependent Fis family transcriptional regulator [Pelosinus]EIW18681.1 PAS sensor protein [Pelosinus fermentans B4]EIW25202.1 proprionate catabolism activator, Fis family [Pelosinus fermentans A11]OAM96466.1 proprionate catabolism activator, Fis family [Pelosinus fermentans DSM 17108]SDR40464.1 PAS domain S-box-containing protein [Pelosinus fermentans]
MSKIAFIAPDKQLFLQGKKIIQELGLHHKFDLYLARLNRGIRIAKKLQNEDIDVIVCRGGTARLIIESRVNIPVVEIPITGQDLAQVFHESKKLTGLPHPKVAILAFSNMVHDIEILSTILDIELTIYPLKTVEDLPSKIAEVAVTDADIVVGGIKTILLAAKKGLMTHLIRSGDFSIRTALLEAQKIMLGRKIEKEKAQEFKALVDYSLEGIISINKDKVIKVFNPTAERLLNLSAKDILGKKIDSILTFINFDTCLLEGQQSIGQVVQLGTIWISFNIAPIIVDQLIIGAIIAFQDVTRIQEMEARIRNELITRKFIARYHFTDLLGVSPQMIESKRIAQEMSLIDATVLISGESGTGKELFAQSIHNESQRRHGPFVAVNCAALPQNLLESELFGYVEGAFTGATKKGKPGLFEMAHTGTIFLDEISEMDKYAQSRLLRVLQEKQVMRLGDDKYIPVDMRIIAATNKNLMELIKEGQFRQDLFYRLKVLTMTLPALRNRKNDIQYLAHHFLEYYKRRHFKQLDISDSGYDYLSGYSWPGNVRELKYFIERLVVIASEKWITEEVIKKYWHDREEETELPATASDLPPLDNDLLPSEDKRITDALAQCHSNITRAAKLLGMDRSTLYRKLKAYKIEIKKSY